MNRNIQKNSKHGRSKAREYFVWAQMKQRCENKAHRVYSLYGGRGIRVCERWRSAFNEFISDMGPRPAGMALERKSANLAFWADISGIHIETLRYRILKSNWSVFDAITTKP